MASSLTKVILCIIFINRSFCQDNDYSYDKIYKFIVEEADSGKFNLLSDLIVENKYLSDRSKSLYQYFEPTHFFNPMEDFTWSFRDEKHKKEEVNFFIPQFEDVFISNRRVYYFTVSENIKIGDKVSYNFKQKYSDIAYFPIIKIPNIDFLENFKILIEHPDYIKPDFSVFFPKEIFSYKIDSSQSSSTSFETGVLHENKELNYFPFNDAAAYVFISLKNKSKNINPTNPKEFTDWYKTIASLDPQLNPEDKNVFADELAKTRSGLEKLKIIYDYVRDNFRYIAEEQDINSFVPRKPSVILKRGYGDCKEKAYLISAIGNENGIKVNMALVTSDDSPELDKIFLTKFDHVICSYDTGNGILFLDPTAKYCEFGNLPENVIGKEALILDQDNPRTVIINPPNQNPFIEIEIIAAIDSLNKANAKIKLRNDYFSAALHARKELTDVKLENFLSTLLTSSLYKISLDYFKFEKEDYNYITFTAKADLSHFIISSSAKKYIPKIPFLFYDKNLLLRREDNFNIYLDKRVKSLLEIKLIAPGYKAVKDSLELKNEDSQVFFKAKTVNGDSSLINFIYEINQSLKKITSSSKKPFLDFCEEYLNNKTNMFILGEKK